MTTMRPGGVEDRFGSALEATRRGAHRARPTVLAVVLPTLAVMTVVAAVVLTTWALFGRGGTTSTTDDVDTASAPDPAVTAPQTPGAGQPGATTEPTTDPTTDATTEPTTDPTGEPTDAVDRTTGVVVLNNTATAGLAKSAGEELTAGGWTVASVGNFTPRGAVTETTVFFARKAQRATAEALAEELGAGVERDAEKAVDGVTVILGPDYTP